MEFCSKQVGGVTYALAAFAQFSSDNKPYCFNKSLGMPSSSGMRKTLVQLYMRARDLTFSKNICKSADVSPNSVVIGAVAASESPIRT